MPSTTPDILITELSFRVEEFLHSAKSWCTIKYAWPVIHNNCNTYPRKNGAVKCLAIYEGHIELISEVIKFRILTRSYHNFDLQLSIIILTYSYAPLSSWEAYRDPQLTTNFKLWVEMFCVPTCFHVRIPKLCLSVRTPRNEITLA